jgi:hypothetical protein
VWIIAGWLIEGSLFQARPGASKYRKSAAPS